MTNFRKSLCSSRRLLTGSVIDSVTISKLVPRSVSQCNLVVLLKKIFYFVCVCDLELYMAKNIRSSWHWHDTKFCARAVLVLYTSVKFFFSSSSFE